MPRFRCNVCSNPPKMHEFEANEPECKACGAFGPPYVGVLADVHFLAYDPAGPLQGSDGRHLRVACQPKRDYLSGGRDDYFHATEQPANVTCPSCKSTSVYEGIARAMQAFSRAPTRPPAPAKG